MKFPNKSTTIYMYTIYILGIILHFISYSDFHNLFSHFFLKSVLILSILLLNQYVILLPPKGNGLSLDSAIYLACIFLYGLDFTLITLLLSSFICIIYYRKTALWKHIFNFALYTFMIIGANYTFISLNGKVNVIDLHNTIPYLVSLFIYFSLNISIIGFFFLLSMRNNLIDTLHNIFEEVSYGYISALLFSLILSILIKAEGIYGAILFTCVAILLSLSFRQYFNLYQETNNKANKDHLTGLSNHGFFKDKLEEEVKIANKTHRSLSLALLDIDDFKKYNDLHGHLQGDQLLKFFGSLLKSNADMHNYFVARYGGEEFVILMPNTTAEQAYAFMERLRKIVNDSYFDGVELLRYHCLSFSAGVVEYEKGVYDSQELLRKADQAMYYAKAQGKNIVHIANKQSKSFSQQDFSYDKQIQDLEQQLHIFLSKDVYTYRHSKRVFQYAVNFSDKLQLGDAEKKTLILGALIHDIGKLEIPRDIINKKSKLDTHEWEIMKKHVLWGKEIISVNKELQELIPLVELHHERFDGKGYPYGLKGEDIPTLARILCIIDSFDAMTTERPYQRTKTFSEAIEELRACSGQQFDPQFVEPFIDMITTCYQQKLKLEQAAMDILHETSEAN
ncbi:diguanylate cyclase [Microbacteriaceae bacterium 4G12]